MKYLEDKLFAKTKDTQSDILFTQWSYDKKLLPKVLQSISSLFPHYSLHDETHSRTIINNIIRILGEDSIDKLSAIDLWFILEASYYHDIGMVVSGKILEQTIESKDFINFFYGLLENQQHNLHEFAIKFKIENNQIFYLDNILSLEQHDGIKFILADYFRFTHSKRSKEIIENPTKEFDLPSPRSLMPQRIFEILGDICSSHTKDFSEVMKLSFCEVGIDTQDIHPRFIACLLRLGDLLDLDNDRFSEVMLSTLSKIPYDTTLHKSKHRSIKSFRADRNEISIIAKCADYNEASIIQHWFQYLNDEISHQMSNWNKIVPCKEIGYLPSIGDLVVELEPYEYIDGKNKPHFSVDPDKALELLRGAGIYEKPSQAFREILQNAVDSTLIRMWEEHKEKKSIFEVPYTNDFVKLMENYPIAVSIQSKKQNLNTNTDEKFKEWEITIEDKAMGLSSNDLKYLMKAGSSSRNNQKAAIVREMPKWLQPSGIFGIGFQSIFQLTDEVQIKTKDFEHEQSQEIKLFSPTSPKNGDILIKKNDTSHKIKPGTKIIFTHKTNIIPDRISFSHDDSNVQRTIDSYDYFSVDSLDVEIAEIIDEIIKFSENCYFPIQLSIDGEPLESLNKGEKPFEYFDEESSLELNIYPNVEGKKYRTITYYKNQHVDNNFDIKFIGINVNIHQDNASKVLTLSRNKIKNEYYEILYPALLRSLFKTIINDFSKLSDKDPKEQCFLSMFLHYYHNENLKDFTIANHEEWKHYNVTVGSDKYSLEHLLNQDEIQIKYFKDNLYNNHIDTYQIENKCLTIELNSSSSSEITTFLLYKAYEYFKSIENTQTSGAYKKIITLRKKQQKSPYSKKDFGTIIKSLKTASVFTARVFLPCMIEEYKHLRIKDNHAIAPWVYNHDSVINFKRLRMPKMLSPYVLEKNDKAMPIKELITNKVYEWVYHNRYDDSTTMEDIKKSYEIFIKQNSKLII